MTMLFTQTYVQGPLLFEADRDSITVDAEGHRLAHICGLPEHVAAHTAAAFNRAMQAVPDGDCWTYTTKSGAWYIMRDLAMGKVYSAQHENVTGDNDPSWMFADAGTLIGVMDEIDAQECDEMCDECKRLVGEDNLTEISRDKYWCKDCIAEESERQAGMAEMAADDKAHAQMEKAARL